MLQTLTTAFDRWLHPRRLHAFTSREEYAQIQIKTNQAKLNKVWVKDQQLETLAAYITEHISRPTFGICHGARNGHEVNWLARNLKHPVIGTDISPTANQFPNMRQWDFHEIVPEWTGRAAWIYTNSLDHSYDPAKALKAWADSLRPDGMIFLHWSPEHNQDFGNGGADCFQASLKGYQDLVKEQMTLLHTIDIRGTNGHRIVVAGLAEAGAFAGV
jgi:hypothetical protein